jgi:putative phosphoribosyl transferase
MLFRDRTEAGERLASELSAYADRPDLLVLGLLRGGVPVAFEVAKALNAPLDIFLVRKLGAPGQRELAMGAIATGGVRVLNEGIVRNLDISKRVIDDIAADEERELERQERAYRGDHFPVQISGRTVILVDEGIATGSTMRAGIAALRIHRPEGIIVAVPVAPPSVCNVLAQEAGEVVCPVRPEFFYAIGQWYQDFRQITDQEIRELLARASQQMVEPAGRRSDTA